MNNTVILGFTKHMLVNKKEFERKTDPKVATGDVDVLVITDGTERGFKRMLETISSPYVRNRRFGKLLISPTPEYIVRAKLPDGTLGPRTFLGNHHIRVRWLCGHIMRTVTQIASIEQRGVIKTEFAPNESERIATAAHEYWGDLCKIQRQLAFPAIALAELIRYWRTISVASFDHKKLLEQMGIEGMAYSTYTENFMLDIGADTFSVSRPLLVHLISDLVYPRYGAAIESDYRVTLKLRGEGDESLLLENISLATFGCAMDELGNRLDQTIISERRPMSTDILMEYGHILADDTVGANSFQVHDFSDRDFIIGEIRRHGGYLPGRYADHVIGPRNPEAAAA
jgi:hypothetical protein